MRKTLTAAIVAALVAATLAGAEGATATLPGTNGKIAFVATGGGVWTMNADGTGQTQVPTTDGAFSSPAWRPDAQKIAYIDAGGIELVNPDGTGAQTLLANPGVDPFGLTWSPDCTKLAYTRSDTVPEATEHIWVVSVASGTTTQLTSGVTLDRAPDWSPDGTKIAFTSTRHVNDPNGLPANGSTNHLLYVMQADGTGVTRLTTLVDPTGSLHEENPSWKPDGTAIAIRSDTDFGEFPNGGKIVVVSSDGSTRTTLTTADDQPLTGRDPVWSPDATKLAVAGTGFATYDAGFVIYDVTTRATTSFAGADPAWAPANGSCAGSSDTVPPVLSVPATINVDATGPLGAAVTYVASATDLVDGTVVPACSPASGTTFPIGDTTVTCTATDRSGNTSAPKSFTVHVRGASEQIANLGSYIDALNLKKKPEKKFAKGVDKIQKELTRGQVSQACRELADLAKSAMKESGKSLTPAQAAQVVEAVNRIEAVLGC